MMAPAPKQHRRETTTSQRPFWNNVPHVCQKQKHHSRSEMVPFSWRSDTYWHTRTGRAFSRVAEAAPLYIPISCTPCLLDTKPQRNTVIGSTAALFSRCRLHLHAVPWHTVPSTTVQCVHSWFEAILWDLKCLEKVCYCYSGRQEEWIGIVPITFQIEPCYSVIFTWYPPPEDWRKSCQISARAAKFKPLHKATSVLLYLSIYRSGQC